MLTFLAGVVLGAFGAVAALYALSRRRPPGLDARHGDDAMPPRPEAPPPIDPQRGHIRAGLLGVALLVSAGLFATRCASTQRALLTADDGRSVEREPLREVRPLSAQIVGIADSFDAITSVRPYTRGSSDETAIQILAGLAGKRFRGDVVAALAAYNAGPGRARGACRREARADEARAGERPLVKKGMLEVRAIQLRLVERDVLDAIAEFVGDQLGRLDVDRLLGHAPRGDRHRCRLAA